MNDYGDEVEFDALDEQAKDEYHLHWCLEEAKEYIEKYGMDKFLHELRVRLEQ
jgi:hypothetical protein